MLDFPSAIRRTSLSLPWQLDTQERIGQSDAGFTYLQAANGKGHDSMAGWV